MLDSRRYLANTARFMEQTITRTVPFTPTDKRNWSPMGAARTTTDVMQECAEGLEMAIKLMKGGQWPAPDPKARAARAAALKKNPAAFEDLQARLQKAVEEYAQTIEKFPAERWMEMVPSPFSGQQVPLANLLGLPVFNMVYHWGQINYIQMMLGDTEMH